MSALDEMKQLQAAGFDDQELGGWAMRRRKELSDAGFGQGEIDTYFGHPPFDPAPIKAMAEENHKAYTKPATEGGEIKQVKDFSEAFMAGLGMSSTALLMKPPTAELAEDAPRSSRIAANVGTLIGDIPAMVGGFIAGGGNPVTGTAGAFALPQGLRKIMMDKYEKGEVSGFGDFWDRFSGAFIDTAKGWITGAATGAVGKAIGAAPIVSPTAKAAATVSGEIATMVTVGKALEGQVPEPNDFIDTAIALGFVKGSAKIAGKLRNIYAQTGVKPSDLAVDAEKDPTILQDLASDKEIPSAYSAAEVKAAKEKVAESISVGEQPKKKLTWDDLYTKTVDELNPIREAVKRAEDLSGKPLETQDDPYQLARLSRGSFGKADHFLEQATYDFKTYKNNGESLKAILSPIKDDLDGLREYAVAKRTLELTGRDVETGVDLEAAKVVAGAGAKKYEPIFRKLVDYQNRLTEYLRDSGVLSDRAYEAMTEANRDYIPFFRLMEEGEEITGGKAGGLKTRQPIKKIKGSERDIIDPLESVIKNTYMYVALAERNAVGTKFIEMAKRSGSPEEFARKIPPTMKPIQLREDEIRALFDEFLTITKKTSKDRSETSKSTSTSADGSTTEAPSKALQMITERVKEALRARGFQSGEVDQMVNRIAAGGKGADHTTVEKVIHEIEKTEYIPELDIRLPNDVALIFRQMQVPLKPNEIAVFTKGKREVYEVDPDVAAAFKASDAETANLLIRMMAVPAKTLRAGSILSPDFIARNSIRDQLSAFILTKGGYIPIFDFVRGAISLKTQDDAYGNWLKSGGANAAMVSVDRQYLQENVFKLTKDAGLMEKSWNVVKSPFEILRVASELTENATRLGEFKRVAGDVTDKGTLQEAGIASREVTLDFARIGAKMRALNMIAAFSNAQIQGVDRIVRAFGENPVGTTAKIAAAVTLPSVLLWYANHDDPRYKEIPQWQKDLFWIVMTKDHIFRIPKPFEIGLIFGTLPERSLDAFFTDNPHAFKDFEKSVLDAFLPNLTPNVAQPIIEQFSNRSLFTGNPIIPSNVEKLLPEFQYADYTTEAAKALGRIVGAFPGMTDRAIKDESMIGGVARALSTPVLVENYIRAWSGGMGMYALQIADKALREAGALPDPVLPAKTLADLPVIKAFVVRYPAATAQSIQDFYDSYYASKKYYDTVMNLAQQGDPRAMRVMRGHEADMAQLSDLREALTEHSQLIRMIHKNPNMTPTDKRQLIDTLYFRMIDLARAGNKSLSALHSAMSPKENP